jgi:hypothetical protein
MLPRMTAVGRTRKFDSLRANDRNRRIGDLGRELPDRLLSGPKAVVRRDYGE